MSYELNTIRSWKKVLESDLDNLGIELKDAISTPAVIILDGEVGAGKTTFTKVLVQDSSQTSSPSYSLINEVGSMVHADFYRLESAEEIIHLELGLYLEGKDFFFVEWGKDYLLPLYHELHDSFDYYLLKIDVNKKKDDGQASRDFTLNEVKFL